MGNVTKVACKWLSGLKLHLNLMKILEKAIMRKVIKDIFLKLTYNILKSYIIMFV